MEWGCFLLLLAEEALLSPTCPGTTATPFGPGSGVGAGGGEWHRVGEDGGEATLPRAASNQPCPARAGRGARVGWCSAATPIGTRFEGGALRYSPARHVGQSTPRDGPGPPNPLSFFCRRREPPQQQASDWLARGRTSQSMASPTLRARPRQNETSGRVGGARGSGARWLWLRWKTGPIGMGGRREEGLGEVAAVLGAPPVRHLLPECLGRPPVSQHPPLHPTG